VLRVDVWVSCERCWCFGMAGVCVCVVCVRLSGIVRLNVEGADGWRVFSHSRVGSRSLLPLIHLVTKQALARALGCFN
jgi:hypothetical protein